MITITVGDVLKIMLGNTEWCQYLLTAQRLGIPEEGRLTLAKLLADSREWLIDLPKTFPRILKIYMASWLVCSEVLWMFPLLQLENVNCVRVGGNSQQIGLQVKSHPVDGGRVGSPSKVMQCSSLWHTKYSNNGSFVGGGGQETCIKVKTDTRNWRFVGLDCANSLQPNRIKYHQLPICMVCGIGQVGSFRIRRQCTNSYLG